MKNYKKYQDYNKPTWAPPAWIFPRVWTVLYILIAISYGYAVVQYFTGDISFIVLLPFILNLIFNAAYTPIQFGLRNFKLALVDILLVLGTLVWLMIVIFPTAPLTMYLNIPYLLWVSFATVLQISVTMMNA